MVIVDRTVVAPKANSPGPGIPPKEANEMFHSSTGLASTTHPVDQDLHKTPPAAPSVEVPSTEVLITTPHVAFSTAAAVGIRRENIGARLVATMRRVFASSTDASRPRPKYEPKRYQFLENALMAREMGRL